MKWMIIVLIVASFATTSVWAYDWPLEPFQSQHQINGTLGEYRSSYFHKGVDISPWDQNPSGSYWLIYSLRSDTILRVDDPNPVNNGFCDRDSVFWYIHLANRIPDRSYVTAFVDTLGRIHTGQGHLHLTEKENRLEHLNPLRNGALAPYADTAKPEIDSIMFYRQGDTTLLSDTLDGKVDILSVAMDFRTDTTGGSAGAGVSVYRIGYEIKDDTGAVKKQYWERVVFDSVPNDGLLDLVYASGSTYDPPHFRYWVTNNPFDTVPGNRNWYWNTKQKDSIPPLPDSVDAESVDVAKFPRGNYRVKVFAYDIGGNYDVDSVQVYVDNFAPRIDSVFPADNATDVPLGTKIELRFNEPMRQTVDLECVMSISPGAMISWQWLDSTRVKGTPYPSLEPNTTYLVTVQACQGIDSLKDIAGWLFDGNRDGLPGGDFQWTFSTGDTMAVSRTSEPQWEGASESAEDSVILESPGVDHLTYVGLFSFCGESYNQIDASESGSIWFHGSGDNTHHFYLPSANGHREGVLAVHNDAIEVPPTVPWPPFRGKIYVKRMPDPNRVIVEWWIRRRLQADSTTNFEVILYDDGRIRYDYKTQYISDFYSDSGSGISCGDTVRYIDISPIYNVAPASYMFAANVPPGDPGNLRPTQGSLKLVWDPNPEGDLKGYYMYRASGADTTDTASLSRLCDTAITVENFVDSLALPCSTYWYAVSAADTFWFESGLSNKVVGTVPPIPGAGPGATAYNTGRKIVKDRDQLRFYVTYASMDSIWATFTDCEGCLWDIPYGIGEGKLPAIAVDDSNHVWIVWIGGTNGEIVYYSTLEGGNWTSPDTLFDFELLRSFGSLSLAMDGSGYGNVLIDQVYSGVDFVPPTSFSTFLIRFYSHEDVRPWVTKIRSSSWLDAYSSIDCDDDGNLHVAWDEGDRISYRKGVISGDTVIWEDPEVISAPAVPSKFPCIEHDRDSLSVVWQAQVGLYYQISHRRKALEDTLWLSIERVDSSATRNTYHPVITGGSHAVWAQDPEPVTVWSARREGTSWTDRRAVKGTPYDSRFPHAASYQGDTLGYLLVCWTEDIQGPGYGVDNRRLQASSLLPTASTSAQLLRAGSRPRTFGLSQNAPNPFVRETRISFTLPGTEDVVLDIYNVAGQRVRRLVNGRMKAGRYEMVWDGTDERIRKVGSGTYFAKLVAGSFQKTRKMVLVR